MSTKLWGGRFAEATDRRVEAMNASIDVDRRLYREDILGSIAHATMLGEQGIVAPDDVRAILEGLRAILVDIEAGRFAFRVDREDVHMNVEAALAERIGPAAGRLHTGRSRNDQVALDVRLWLRRAVVTLHEGLEELRAALLTVAARHVETLMPGYTHLQRAQPVTLAHTLLAFEAMLVRDAGRLRDAFARIDELPLGAGALAGSPFPLDRQRVATLLGFPRITSNSQDAVANRDHLVEVTAACALCMAHLSQLSETLILWSTSEFGFVELPDAFCTGSSIMPQKKNPDVAELVRGQAARVTGDLVALLGLLKGLPLAYNKDLQEDKAPLFHAVDTVETALAVLPELLRRARFRKDRLAAALVEGHLTATELADALAERGLPFREAHHVVGRLVAEAQRRRCALVELPSSVLAAALPDASLPLVEILSPARAVARRQVPGGPAPERVREAIREARRGLARDRRWRSRTAARVRAPEALLAPPPSPTD